MVSEDAMQGIEWRVKMLCKALSKRVKMLCQGIEWRAKMLCKALSGEQRCYARH